MLLLFESWRRGGAAGRGDGVLMLSLIEAGAGAPMLWRNGVSIESIEQ